MIADNYVPPVGLAALLDIDLEALSWQAGALCAQVDPEPFYPELGQPSRTAKRICSMCDVRAECLAYALANDELFGIWGGLSEREREDIRMGRAPIPLAA